MSTCTRRSKPPQHRRAAARRALPRAARRAAAADPRRAEFGAERARDRAAVRRAAGPARARHHHALRLAPAGGSVFASPTASPITRNGRDVLTKDRPPTLTIPEVIEGMIGQQREALFPPPLPPTARHRRAAASMVRDLAGGRLDNVSLHRPLRRGRRPGRAGRVGRLRHSSSCCSAFARRAQRRGHVSRRRGLPKSPTDAARRRVCLVPADRRRNGLMLDKSHPVQHRQRRRRRARRRLAVVPAKAAAERARGGRSTRCASRRLAVVRSPIRCPAATSRRW